MAVVAAGVRSARERHPQRRARRASPGQRGADDPRSDPRSATDAGDRALIVYVLAHELQRLLILRLM